MNAVKFTHTSTIVAAAFGLALGLMSAPAALANPADENGCHSHKSCSAGDGDTTPGNESIPLVFTLTDTDNLMNDGDDLYVHKEGKVRALAGGPSGRFPSLQLGLLGVGKDPRTLTVFAACTDIPFIDPPLSNCEDVPDGLLGVERGHVYLALRPYAVDCPDPDSDGFCPGIFTMGSGPEHMSFMVRFDEGLTIEVASNMGGGAPNPGWCLSLLSDDDRHAYLEGACQAADPIDPEECNVTVTAEGPAGGDNDSWLITGDAVRALICDPPSGTIFGETFISVDLEAITK